MIPPKKASPANFNKSPAAVLAAAYRCWNHTRHSSNLIRLARLKAQPPL